MNTDSALEPISQETKRETQRNYKKWLLPAFLLILVQLLVMVGVFSRAEMSLYDAWFRLRGPQSPGEQTVIVAVDDSSLGRLGSWPWPRSTHAKLLQKLEQARVVCFDFTFNDPQNPENDQAFADAIAKHGGVVLSGKFFFDKDSSGELTQGLLAPIPQLIESQPALGFVNMSTDADGTVRRCTLVDTNFADVPVPGLGLAVAMQAQGLTLDDLKLSDGFLYAGKEKIPINAQNQALPTFWGPMATFKTIPYADIIEGKISPDYFKDKIVMIGPETAEDKDTYPTPCTTSNMVKKGSLPSPGVEIHASVAQSILSSSWYREVPSLYNFLFLLLLGLITSLVVSGRGPWLGLLGSLGTMAVAIGTTYLLWNHHWWLNLAAPIVLIVLTYVVVTATDFIQAEMGRRKTKAIFSRYVSADVVEQLISNPDQMALGGKKQVVTIMFADIRGFTAFSENKDPVDVIARLNEYLTAMTSIIMKHGGTLDKYLGDGLMAFFGAPIYYEDHVERAIAVAGEIQQEVINLNKKWTEAGHVPLLVAIGVNTGPVVVGNVGSPERMDYTLIGEDANLASRVEALTKLFETLVLVSERSYECLPEGKIKDSLYYVGEELVKGFTNPIKVYSLTGLDLHFEKSKDKGFK